MKTVFLSCVTLILCVAGQAYAQNYNQVQQVQPVQQFQPYQDNVHQNAPSIIPKGNAIGIDRVIPTNNQRDLNGSNNFNERNGVAVQNLRKNKGNNQPFINQALGRNGSVPNSRTDNRDSRR